MVTYPEFPDNCERCGKPLKKSYNSVFNDDYICKKCDKRERYHPAYPKAKIFDDARSERWENALLKMNIELKLPFFGLPDDLKGGSKKKKKKDRTINDILKAM